MTGHVAAAPSVGIPVSALRHLDASLAIDMERPRDDVAISVDHFCVAFYTIDTLVADVFVVLTTHAGCDLANVRRLVASIAIECPGVGPSRGAIVAAPGAMAVEVTAGARRQIYCRRRVECVEGNFGHAVAIYMSRITKVRGNMVAIRTIDLTSPVGESQMLAVRADADGCAVCVASQVLGGCRFAPRPVARIAGAAAFAAHFDDAIDVTTWIQEDSIVGCAHCRMAGAAVVACGMRGRRRCSVASAALALTAVDKSPQRILEGAAAKRGAVAVDIAAGPVLIASGRCAPRGRNRAKGHLGPIVVVVQVSWGHVFRRDEVARGAEDRGVPGGRLGHGEVTPMRADAHVRSRTAAADSTRGRRT